MKTIIRNFRLIVIACLLASGLAAKADLRRPISPSQPAWIIHIDVWNYADPQKIIDMVPEDVRPYVIFNIATSSSDEKSPDGSAIYDSWMKICAQNRVWAMIQCASGAYNRLPDTPADVSVYEKYYQEYPNFLGFNFAEQYWGFDSEGGVSFDGRLKLFAKLLSLSKAYGGYLAVSFADTYHNAGKSPLAYVKRNADISEFLSTSPGHFLCFEKYTQKKNFLYNESHCLGAWLSGIAGQYGIRFDSSGWVEKGVKPDMQDGDTQYAIGASDFVRAAGAIPVAEHMMLTGQTIMDGPELSWTECSTEASTSTVDGYTRRNWQWMPQWNAITLSLFRKILDGTIRIPSKEEVLARTKVCVVSGGSGTDNDSYRIPAALYDRLYRNTMDYGGLQGRDANHWLNNRWWMKSTGRYPAIPNMLSAGALTDIGSLVGNTSGMKDYLDKLFAEEYAGDIFAGRLGNGWVTYNPYQYDDVTSDGIRTLSRATRRASGTIPFQYNSCESISLDYAPYSLGIIKEYSDRVTIYLQNYEGGRDIIKISGATSEPTYSVTSGSVSKSWDGQELTLTIEHSGEAVELTINCKGSATDRKTADNSIALSAPAEPAAYSGKLQYEAELADYKNATIQKSGYGQNRDGYYGQGFAQMRNTSGSLRFYTTIPQDGQYIVTVRYQSEAKGSIALLIGGKSLTMTTESTSEWKEIHMPIALKAGQQRVFLNNTGGKLTYIDCLQLEKQFISPFNYSTISGEYHAELGCLSASGGVDFDATSGRVSVPAGKSGALTLLLNVADFSKVTNVILSRDNSSDDAFSYLRISDINDSSVNPSGSQGGFWSSKYRLDYSSYQSAEASRQVYKIEWVANSSETDRTMVISDIMIKVDISEKLGVIDESAGVPALIPSATSSYDIKYTRMLTAPESDAGDVMLSGSQASLYSVCLPYKPKTGLGLKYFTLAGVSDGTLLFEEVSAPLANTPYLVAVTSGEINVGNASATTVDFASPISYSDNYNGYQLKGTLRGMTHAEAQGRYILQTGNLWGKVPASDPTVYIPPFRAYIEVSGVSTSAPLRSAVRQNETAIRQIKTTDHNGDVHLYDLNGRQIDQPTQKGIYIRNGKKVVLH